ncbi:MAG: lipopolysaccharide assembly protein LapA domain-containing protein [Bacteroidia bacterium]|nr:DUF1049 domain-containing protein [Bacteroidia bacterium]MCZ2277878.1 lipopolysaccharide assembly protein LapA domain-containing protein [Bacteroidia bacterium]
MKQPILTIIVALIAVVFAIQNAESVQIRFLLWDTSCSLALLIVIILLAGMIAGYFLQWPRISKLKKDLKSALSEKHTFDSSTQK